MRYELINTTVSDETDVHDVVNNPDGTTIETLTDKFCVAIYLCLKSTENEAISTVPIIVENHNDDSEDVISIKRQNAINEFMAKINDEEIMPIENSQRMSIQKEVITEEPVSEQWAEVKKNEESPSNNRVFQIILILSASAVLGTVIYWFFIK